MKKLLLISPVILGLAVAGCNRSTESESAAVETDSTYADANARADNDLSRAADNVGDAMERAGERTAAAFDEMSKDLSAQLSEWRLSAEEITADIEADRPIVRTKSTAGAPTGAMDESTLQSAVEARIKGDSQLAAAEIDVNAKDQGEIELEGEAQSVDQIGRAIALALGTEGVSKVTSKIDLDK